MRTAVCVGVILGVASLSAAAEQSLTTKQKITFALMYPFALHQLPATTLHEGTHWLTARAFGDRPTIYLLPSYVDTWDGPALAGGYVEHRKKLTPVQGSILAVAPYIVQLAVVNGIIVPAYRQGRIPIDSLGDKYLQNVLLLDYPTPLMNCVSEESDLGQLGRHIHVHRYLLGAIVQAVQTISYNRFVKARGHGDSTWLFYFHKTF